GNCDVICQWTGGGVPIGWPPESATSVWNVTVSPMPVEIVSGVTAIWPATCWTVTCATAVSWKSGPVCVASSVPAPISRAVTNAVMRDGPPVLSTVIGPVELQLKIAWPFGGITPPTESTNWTVTGREQKRLP